MLKQMADEHAIFTKVPRIAHAMSLGKAKAYVGRGTGNFCCRASNYHRHACYEIVWISGATARYFVDFREIDVPDGSLVFISPGQVHTWLNPADAAELTVIGFTPDLFALDMLDVQKTLINLPFFIENASPVYTVPDQLRPLFQQQFNTAWERGRGKNEQSETLIRAYLNLLLIEAQNMIEASPAPIMSAPAPMRLTRRFRLAVESDYIGRKQVQEYADQLGVTSNHLVETVRETTGATPKSIIQERLLLEAKRLLAYSSLSAAQVGNELSFPNPAQFGRWFKINAGVAPGQFRQQLTAV